MIQLTRLNNQPFTVNSDLIKFIEQLPDTVLTLLNGEKILVQESPAAIRDRIVEFRRLVWAGIAPGAGWPAHFAPLGQAEGKAEERRR